MAIRSVVISSGHGSKIRGAAGPEPWGLDEVDEARRVVERVVELFKSVGVEVQFFNDDVSTTQDANLKWLVSHHNNAGPHDLDVSVHFNAYTVTSSPMGCEVLYVTQSMLASKISAAIAEAGKLKNRGGKYRGDLYFLNNTREAAVLLECAFVDSHADADLYRAHFNAICGAIVEAISDQQVEPIPPEPVPPDPPPDPGPDPEPPTPVRPTLAKGDKGPDVIYLQEQLNSDNNAGLEADGIFGSQTDSAVRGYQASRNLDVDGIVGPQTWTALDMNAPPYVPPGLPDRLSQADEDAIRLIAANSAIARYGWRDRGQAPAGYTQGVALTFANVYRKFLVGHAPALEMAQARTGNSKDIFNEYQSEFTNAGLSTTGGVESLISLWSLLLGLGMRESSGKHCCGRDQSASNTTSDTCEAGAWQTSWNAHTSERTLDQTFEEYSAGAGSDNPQGFLTTFKQGVSCSSSDWSCYGSGNGYRHQQMSKEQPAYAAEFAAITLRNLCNHYGPINRHEAELRQDAAHMLRAVQDYVDQNIAVTS